MGRVIFVTGFKGGVGKTTVSANIAATLYALGNKVLVVDGDFGMRCMDMVLGMESETLFDCSDILSGRCSPTAALTEVAETSDFSFIPAPMNLTDSAFSKSAYSAFFADLRDEFDYIIIDTAPINIVSDALLLHDKINGYILVTRSDYSDVNETESCIEALERVNAEIFGIVLTSLKLKSNSRSGKYLKYNRYSKYGKYSGKYTV